MHLIAVSAFLVELSHNINELHIFVVDVRLLIGCLIEIINLRSVKQSSPLLFCFHKTVTSDAKATILVLDTTNNLEWTGISGLYYNRGTIIATIVI